MSDDSVPAGVTPPPVEPERSASDATQPHSTPGPNSGNMVSDAAAPAPERDDGARMEGDAPGTPGTAAADEAPDPYDELALTADPYEGAVPPGYDWPTHGGYLGCLLGTMAACVLGGFLGSSLVGLVSVTPLAVIVSGAPLRIVLILGTFVVTMLVLGRVGWRLGKRFYREYPTPTRRSSRGATTVVETEEHEPPQEAS